MKIGIEFTHYWVPGFGWENTIFIETDFEKVEEFGKDGDNIVFVGINKGDIINILKGKYI